MARIVGRHCIYRLHGKGSVFVREYIPLKLLAINFSNREGFSVETNLRKKKSIIVFHIIRKIVILPHIWKESGKLLIHSQLSMTILS